VAQSNIYALKDNGDLRLLAEIEGEDDPALAVDALLDEMPRLKQREFIVINLDNVMTVEAGDEIVNPRREIKVSGYNGAVATPEADEDEDEEQDEDDVEDEQEEPEEAPKPAARRGRGRKSGTAKAPARKPASSKKKGGSPFRSNPKSAE